jgi:hypothetical protein
MQVKCGHIFAMLLNRLSANMLPDAWKPPQWQGRKHTVQLTAGGASISSPGDLLKALTDEMHAQVTMAVVSRITSFGAGVTPHLHAPEINQQKQNDLSAKK